MFLDNSWRCFTVFMRHAWCEHCELGELQFTTFEGQHIYAVVRLAFFTPVTPHQNYGVTGKHEQIQSRYTCYTHYTVEIGRLAALCTRGFAKRNQIAIGTQSLQIIRPSLHHHFALL